jgi:hypothetical protein
MSKMFSPATPHKSPSRSANDYDDASSIENGASITKGNHQVLLHEPSPASTYGDTEVDGSDPATPQEDGLLGTSFHRFFPFSLPSAIL